MRDLPGDKSQTRSGLLRGWLRCAIMRIVNVGVFSFFFIPPMYQHLGQHQRRGWGGGGETHRGDDTQTPHCHVEVVGVVSAFFRDQWD